MFWGGAISKGSVRVSGELLKTSTLRFLYMFLRNLDTNLAINMLLKKTIVRLIKQSLYGFSIMLKISIHIF